MDWIDTIWTGAMWVLLGIAAAVVAWAVLGDWWRGKRAIKRGGERRCCSRCWYDMRGIAGLRCPECGRAAKSERGLQRSRVRWRGVLVGLLVLVPAWVAAKMPEVRVGGWGRLVPTAVLACWPMDVGAWVNGNPVDWAGKELESRHGREMPGWIGERVLAWRVASRWRDESDWEVAILDTSHITQNSAEWIRRGPWATRGDAAAQFPLGPWQMNAGTRTDELCDVVEFGTWLSRGGHEGRFSAVGNRIVVACGPERMDRVRRLLGVLAGTWSMWSLSEVDDLLLIGLMRTDIANTYLRTLDRAKTLEDIITTCIEPGHWSSNGGDVGRVEFWRGGALIVSGEPRLRERVKALVGAIELAEREQSPKRLDPAECMFEGKPAVEHVAVWPVRHMLKAWGAMSEEEFAAWVSIDPENRDPAIVEARIRREGRAAIAYSRKESEIEAYVLLLERLKNLFTNEDEWPPRLRLFDDVLVLSTVYPGMVEVIDAALKDAENGPGGMCAD